MSAIQPFPKSFNAVDKWQQGGDRKAKLKRGNRLVAEVHSLSPPLPKTSISPVFRLDTMTSLQTYMWGGRSGPVEDLASMVFGHPVTSEKMFALKQLMESANVSLGPDWLSPAGTKRAIERTLNRAHDQGLFK